MQRVISGVAQMQSIFGVRLLAALLFTGLPISLAQGQFPQAGGVDPRPPLAALIHAFQHCGPPQVYQMLGQQVFQAVEAQTQGRGCYPQLQQIGPVVGMQITGHQQFPVGPLFSVRVQHQSGVATDWFIGMNLYTNRVEYLTFQASQGGAPPPDIVTGPRPGPDGGGSPRPSPPPPGASDDGCALYPAMCVR
jgi:hypothetical protein